MAEARKIHIGNAEVFLGGTIPADKTTPISVTNGAPSLTGAVSVGYTEGAASLKIKTDKKKLTAEQVIGHIDAIILDQEVSLEFTMKETDYSVLKDLLAGVTYADDATGTPKTRQLVGGGKGGSMPSKAVTLISQKRIGASSLYFIACLYDAYLDDDFEQSFKKGDETLIKIRVVGKNIVSRAKGDQVYQLVEQYETLT